MAVSLSVSTWTSSLPLAWQLYLPQIWTQDRRGRKKAGVPEEVRFQSKPQMALAQIRRALEEGVPVGVLLADAGYGSDGQFRAGLTELGLRYVLGVPFSISVWERGQQPLPAKPWKGTGRRPKRLRRNPRHPPVSAKQLALALPATAWSQVPWREGSAGKLRSRFAAVRVSPAHRDSWHPEPHPEEWLLIEWPHREVEPTKYWLSTLPAETKLPDLVALAKHRWIVERDYQELKQELGLGHYEGRGWRGFHHHATLCIAAYGFLVAERNQFSPWARVGGLRLSVPKLAPGFQPRGAPGSRRRA